MLLKMKQAQKQSMISEAYGQPAAASYGGKTHNKLLHMQPTPFMAVQKRASSISSHNSGSTKDKHKA